MYRDGVRPWRSAGWKPREKHIHERANSIREVKEKGDKESGEE